MNKKKENLVKFYLLSFTWGIITTLLGLVVLAAMSIYKIFTKDKVKISMYRGRILVELVDTYFGGFSMGIVIVTDGAPDSDLVNHEVGHSIQNIYMGPLFLIIVGIPSMIRYHMFDWLAKRHYNKTGNHLDYDSVWFEAQATRLGGKHKYV